jgi:hypothetical protein
VTLKYTGSAQYNNKVFKVIDLVFYCCYHEKDEKSVYDLQEWISQSYRAAVAGCSRHGRVNLSKPSGNFTYRQV